MMILSAVISDIDRLDMENKITFARTMPVYRRTDRLSECTAPMDKKAVRLEREHLAGAERLERLCFSEPWSQKSLEMLLASGAVGFAVLDNECVAAYGGMMTVLDEGQITNIAVDPAYRRRGYGKTIVRELISYAKENGIASISLEVRESNAAAISLYGSLGFDRRGVRKNFYRSPTESAIVMVWERERT